MKTRIKELETSISKKRKENTSLNHQLIALSTSKKQRKSNANSNLIGGAKLSRQFHALIANQMSADRYDRRGEGDDKREKGKSLLGAIYRKFKRDFGIDVKTVKTMGLTFCSARTHWCKALNWNVRDVGRHEMALFKSVLDVASNSEKPNAFAKRFIVKFGATNSTWFAYDETALKIRSELSNCPRCGHCNLVKCWCGCGALAEEEVEGFVEEDII